MNAATSSASAVAMVPICSRPGSDSSMPSRVVNTGRRSRTEPRAVRRLTVNQTAAAAKTRMKSTACVRSDVV